MPRPDLVGSAGPILQEAFDQGLAEPEEVFGAPEAQAAVPDGKWFVHARQGIPYQASENADPDNVWRLVFDEAQLAEAYPRRQREGYPILINPQALRAPDWLQQFERARLDQYEHPDFQIDFQRLRGGLTPPQENEHPVNTYLGVRERMLEGLLTNPIPGTDLDQIRKGLLRGRPSLPPLEESFNAPAPEAKPTMLARHERSETVQLPDGSWVNVFGRGTAREGEPLEPKFEFEKLRYPSKQEAEAAARRRSEETQPSTATEGMSPRDRKLRHSGPANF